VVEDRDANNLPSTRYTRGKDLSGTLAGAGGIGGLLASSDPGLPASSHYFYHADADGNVTATISALQRSVGQYGYEPFGTAVSISGPAAARQRYYGWSKEAHSASGLAYYLYRYYSPVTHRWANADPVCEPGFNLLRKARMDKSGCGRNPYTFQDNDPLNSADSVGLSCWTDCMVDAYYDHLDELFGCLKSVGAGAAFLAQGCVLGCTLSEAGYVACLTGCLAAVARTAGIVGACCAFKYEIEMTGAALGCTLGCD